MKKRLLAAGIMMILMVCMLAGCGQRETAFSKENNYTQEIMEQSSKWIYQGECIGYGIPYTTQFTQPETMQRAPLPALNINGYDKGWNEYFTEVLPQADPNGLYSSASTSATWILTTDKDGNIKPTYVESEITVAQIKLDARLCEEWSIPNNY